MDCINARRLHKHFYLIPISLNDEVSFCQREKAVDNDLFLSIIGTRVSFSYFVKKEERNVSNGNSNAAQTGNSAVRTSRAGNIAEEKKGAANGSDTDGVESYDNNPFSIFRSYLSDKRYDIDWDMIFHDIAREIGVTYKKHMLILMDDISGLSSYGKDTLRNFLLHFAKQLPVYSLGVLTLKPDDMLVTMKNEEKQDSNSDDDATGDSKKNDDENDSNSDDDASDDASGLFCDWDHRIRGINVGELLLRFLNGKNANENEMDLGLNDRAMKRLFEYFGNNTRLFGILYYSLLNRGDNKLVPHGDKFYRACKSGDLSNMVTQFVNCVKTTRFGHSGGFIKIIKKRTKLILFVLSLLVFDIKKENINQN